MLGVELYLQSLILYIEGASATLQPGCDAYTLLVPLKCCVFNKVIQIILL